MARRHDIFTLYQQWGIAKNQIVSYDNDEGEPAYHIYAGGARVYALEKELDSLIIALLNLREKARLVRQGH